MEMYILDGDGNPKCCNDMHEWGAFLNNPENKIIHHHRAIKGNDTILISTVFLGLDHNFDGGLPLLFETMIFGDEHDQYQDRYHTKEEALAGHIEALNLVDAQFVWEDK